MPLYTFQSVENEKEFKDFFYEMKSVPTVGAIIKDEEGKEWKRVFTIPQANMGTSSIDPYSKDQFVKGLEGKNYTLGDLWDKSKELSEKREKTNGKDPIKEEYFNKYKKKNKGAKHPQQLKVEQEQKMKEIKKKLDASS